MTAIEVKDALLKTYRAEIVRFSDQAANLRALHRAIIGLRAQAKGKSDEPT